jgi:hypothetical protein
VPLIPDRRLNEWSDQRAFDGEVAIPIGVAGSASLARKELL